MASQERLRQQWRPVARAVLTDEVLRQQRAVKGAVNMDSTIHPQAIQSMFSPQLLGPFYLAGASVAGSNKGPEIPVPYGIRIRRLDVSAKTAPGAGGLMVRLTADGVILDYARIDPGETRGEAFDLDIPVEHAATYRVDVVTAGGADVTVVAWVLPIIS